VSYDEALLTTRQQILSRQTDYAVMSVRDFSEALNACRSDEQFDLLIVGHSIPHTQKEELIHAFREKHPKAAVIALKRQDETVVRDADLLIEPHPNELLKSVGNLLSGHWSRAFRARRKDFGLE
jgi:DNA-binding NtrC family response regulator